MRIVFYYSYMKVLHRGQTQDDILDLIVCLSGNSGVLLTILDHMNNAQIHFKIIKRQPACILDLLRHQNFIS